MTDKERLEEIKRKFDLDRIRRFVDTELISPQDLIYLIQQTERVEELEEEVDRLNGALHFQLSEENIKNERIRKLHRQNRRYREALEKAIDDLENECLWDALVALKALEGEK